jgi:predicted amidohydrolase
VQLLVYPEFAFVSPKWSAACEAPTQAPTAWCPPFPRGTTCGGGSGANASAATFAAALACTARDANMTLSYNVCEGDGAANWNSQVVFLPDGTMKAVYRKTHPFMRKCYAAPAEPDLVYFTSKQYLPLPENASAVGIFTCKDILYKQPSNDLYARGVRVFIYSSKIPLVGRLAKDLWTKAHPGAYLIASDASTKQSGVFINGSRLPFESLESGRVVVTEILQHSDG